MSAASPTKESIEEASVGVDHELASPTNPLQRPHWFRSTFFNITILGFCSFLAPGIWGAMSATGGGGQQSVSLVNAANSSTFCLMVVTGLLTPTLIRLTNVRIALSLGGVGYSVYAAGLYLHGKNGTEWLVVFGAVCCGISAGTFWATEGSIALAYPERAKQGFYLSYWLMYRVMGQFLGGAINLGLNANNDQAGSLSSNTYIVFIVLQCLGPFVALLISLPEQVQRKDGTPVLLRLQPTAWQEIKSMAKIIVTPNVLLLLPLIWQGTFSEALIGTYAASHFTVRSRALGSFLSAIVAALCNYIQGFFLDNQRTTINARGKSLFLTIYGMQIGWWIFAIIIMNRYEHTKPTLDWGQSEWNTGFALYIMLQIGFNLMYEYTYWIVGSSNQKSSEIVRLASIIRSVESAGQAVSYGINSTTLRLDAVAGINFGLLAIALPPAWLVVRKVGILEDGTKLVKFPIYAEDDEQREELAKSGVVDATDAKGATAANH